MIVKVQIEDGRILPIPLVDKIRTKEQIIRLVKSILLVHYDYTDSFRIVY
jgi:hypothetical protein